MTVSVLHTCRSPGVKEATGVAFMVNVLSVLSLHPTALEAIIFTLNVPALLKMYCAETPFAVITEGVTVVS